MSRYLIIHADDLGMSHSVNRAIFDAFEAKAITSASIMSPCSWFPEVVQWALKHSEYDLGVHLTFTSEWGNYRWRPVYNATSLVDKDKYFFKTVEEFQAKAEVREVEAEVQGQIERVIRSGIKPSHVDSHMFAAGVFAANPRLDILRAVSRIAYEYGIYFEGVTKVLIADPFVSKDKWYEHYDKLLSEVPEGISKLIVHPGYDDTELKTITEGYVAGNAASRIRDMEVITSEHFKRSISKYNIQLISWKDVKGIPCV